jgi:hypothetical protein
MTWEAYCRKEALECVQLARDEQGEARTAWIEAARQWWRQGRRPKASKTVQPRG